ncbi:hypothetical protein [Nocardioides sp. W7]|uniref:hypothetical protein n=1 Tax=Nocardioides sp. W7 TaxID=2931390 RepID=UPI001FD5438F|nr:hypothetical protein [Nocardioides sp. W7]
MRARLVALVVAAVLGAGGGVTTALLDDEDGGARDPRPAPVADPLGINLPLVNLECTGEAVLVVGFGDRPAALRTEVVNTPDEDLRYLDTQRSCDARWTPARSTAAPRWVVYTGPGDRTDLCLARLTERAHQRDNVTFLRAGSDQRAMCLCEVAADAAPPLEIGTPAASDPGNRIWIGELQDMLITIDAELRADEAVRLTEANRTGVYDRPTADRVNVVRANAKLPENGVLDKQVWSRVTSAGCPLYDYS